MLPIPHRLNYRRLLRVRPRAVNRRLHPVRTMTLVNAVALVTLVGALSLPGDAQAASSGSLRVAPGKSSSRAVTAGRLKNATARGKFEAPVNRPVWAALQFRTASGRAYRARAQIRAGGVVWVGFSRVRGGVEKVLDTKRTNVRVGTHKPLYIEGSVTGTNPVKLAVRAWRPGTAKPKWQVRLSDKSSARITKAGQVRTWAYLSSHASSASRVWFSGVTAKSVVASKPTAPRNQPTASSTGVPAGATLKRHDGTITVTKDGTVLDHLDIHGFVIVKAKNVKITNSIVRGGWANGYATGLITNYGYPGLVIENVDVKAEHPSVYFDGIKGWDFTARRVHVQGNVDSVKIHGSNVTVADSLLENTQYYAHDPYQDGGPTHNDNIQILRGKNIRITGNTIRGATNFAILGGAEQADVDLYANGNWLDGGHCTVKLQTRGRWSETATVTNNKFGPHRAVQSCPFTAYPDVHLQDSGNVFASDGSQVGVLRVVS